MDVRKFTSLFTSLFVSPLGDSATHCVVIFCADSYFIFFNVIHFFNKCLFFYKQTVYKQLAFTRKIAKQILRLNPFSLSNNKNYSLKKSRVFPKFRTHRLLGKNTTQPLSNFESQPWKWKQLWGQRPNPSCL